MAIQTMKWVVSIFPKYQNQAIEKWKLSMAWSGWIEKNLEAGLDNFFDFPHTLTKEEIRMLQKTIPYPFDFARYDYVLDIEPIEEEFWAHQVVGVCL